ncbi:MAG: hypothetical protein RJA36_821 [Pseudomonadota bacterium]|jgi:hypothetical protein
MIAKKIGILLTLATSTAFAAGPKATPCLSAKDVKGCLAGVAIATVTTEKSPEARADGTASLLTSLAKAGVRRDELLSAASDEEAAPSYSRWTLALARRTYALRYGIDSAAQDSPQRIEAQAELLRGQRDGLQRLMLAWAACEAREVAASGTIAKWDGTLDRLCRVDAVDSASMEKDFPGLSVLAAAVVDAYNHDEASLGRSIAASRGVLSEYDKALNRKISTTERVAIQGILVVGNMLNATALAISNRGSEAAKAIEISIGHLAKAPSLGSAPEFQMTLAQASWIYAKAGMREKALATLRKTLARVDGGSVSGGERASVIGIVIETLRTLESVR